MTVNKSPAYPRSKDDRGRTNIVLMLALIMIVGMAVRTLQLGRELWGDEQATLFWIRYPIWLIASAPKDETPFLYYGLHKLLLSGATTPAEIRALSYACGVLAIPLIYVAVRTVFNRSGAVVAALLLAVWPLHVRYSQEARAHSLLFLLVLLSLTGLFIWLDQLRTGRSVGTRRAGLALFCISAVLAFSTHLLSVLWIGIAIPVLLWRTAGLRCRPQQREVLICLALMAIIALPGLHWFGLRLSEGHLYHWLQQASPFQAANIFALSIMPPLQAAVREAWIREQGVPAWQLGILFGLIGIAFASMANKVPAAAKALAARPHETAILIGLGMVPPLLWIAGYAYVPLLTTRNIAWAASGPVILSAILLDSIKAPALRAVATTCTVATLFATVLLSFPSYAH